MKKQAESILSIGLVLLCFGLLICFPHEASAAAVHGLQVCGSTIVPSLLPFFVLSGLLIRMGFPEKLGKRLAPVFSRLKLPVQAAVPFLLGLSGGYPIGASALAELVEAGSLRREDGERLLPCCNNTGPAFLIGVAGSAVFGSVKIGIVLYLCHILAALNLLLFRGRKCRAVQPDSMQSIPRSLLSALPESLNAAVRSLLNVSGFVVFFSVLSGIAQAVGLLSGLAGAISLHFGTELQFSRVLLTGLLELGGGIAGMRGLCATPKTLALAAFLLGFGSLSVHCQTLSVVAESKMKCARHFLGRIFHGALSALFAFFFFTLLQI